MAISRHKSLLQKSIQASVAAIEVYNKPDFKYREETFAILMINAWELLLKAKILKDSKGNPNSIFVPEKTHTSEGKKLKRFYPKRNRSGNALTLDVFSALNKVEVDSQLKENINLLIEIRDNAIHFINDSKEFEKVVLEIGTASLKSYVSLVNEWFDYSLDNYNFYLMPISFFHTFEMESFSTNSQTKQIENFFAYVSKKLIDNPTNLNRDHNIALKLETRLEKSVSAEALPVRYSSDSPIVVRQEIENKIRDGLEKGSLFDYENFIKKLKEKYPDFKINAEFHNKCKELKGNEKFSLARYLDPLKQTGTPKYFWTSEAVKEIGKLYE